MLAFILFIIYALLHRPRHVLPGCDRRCVAAKKIDETAKAPKLSRASHRAIIYRCAKQQTIIRVRGKKPHCIQQTVRIFFEREPPSFSAAAARGRPTRWIYVRLDCRPRGVWRAARAFRYRSIKLVINLSVEEAVGETRARCLRVASVNESTWIAAKHEGEQTNKRPGQIYLQYICVPLARLRLFFIHARAHYYFCVFRLLSRSFHPLCFLIFIFICSVRECFALS